jgi:hypothetical protein
MTTNTGESRPAYARRELKVVVPITERFLRDWEDSFPPPIFIFGDRFYTGRQLTLLYGVQKKEIDWSQLTKEWEDPDTDEDVWPQPKTPPLENARPGK